MGQEHINKKPVRKRLLQLQPGEYVFHEGDRGDTMFLIVSGTLQILKTFAGTEKEINLLGTGDFFGEISIVLGESRLASARALTEAKLMEINKQDFENLLKLDVEVPIRIIRRLGRSLRMTQHRLENALTGQPMGPREELDTEPLDLMGVKVHGQAIAELRLEHGDLHWPIHAIPARIGRIDKVTGIVPEVDLDEVPERNSISRYHAQLLHDGTGFALMEEIGVKNGTYVNKHKLEPGIVVPLADRDRIVLGSVALHFAVLP